MRNLNKLSIFKMRARKGLNRRKKDKTKKIIQKVKQKSLKKNSEPWRIL